MTGFSGSFFHASGIRDSIAAIVNGTATHAQVTATVRLCHSLARVFLSRKARIGLLGEVHGLTQSDLAYDCIADLFSRDTEGAYVQLRTYFSVYPPPELSDQDVVFHLQRLIASKVEQGVSRLFREVDPQFAKILRNVKLSIHGLELFTEIERVGEPCIAPALCDPLLHLVSIDPQELEESLLQQATGSEFVPQLMARLAGILREQKRYSRVVPIIQVAALIKRVYEQKRSTPLLEVATIDEAEIDCRTVVDATCTELRGQAFRSYVSTDKVTPELMAVYLQVIRQGLHDRYLKGDGGETGLYERLKLSMPSLSYVEYRASHRSRLEYLARQAERKMAEKLEL